MEEEDVRVAVTEKNLRTKVMVAIDDSEFSEHALMWALKTLGSSIVDSELLIYTARSPVDISYLYASSWGTAELIKELKESEKKAAVDLLNKAKTTCASYGITAEGMTDWRPESGYMQRSREVRYSVACAVTRTLVGSVSNYCVNHAKCPVLVVKKTD